jgi:glucose/mannose-6-phosphate isomerase
MPLAVLKHYRTPAFVGERTLAFALSYSGDTEETLEMTRGALSAGARLIALSRGGELEELAREHGALHIGCPVEALMPRFALGAMVAPLVVVLFRMGLLPEGHATLLEGSSTAGTTEVQPGRRSSRNPARTRQIGRTIPVVYGAGGFGAVARCAGSARSTNAKAPRTGTSIQLDHNEIAAGANTATSPPGVTIIELHQGLEHPQLERRMKRRERSTKPCTSDHGRSGGEPARPIARRHLSR